MKMTQIYARAYAGTLTLEDIRKAFYQRINQQNKIIYGKDINMTIVNRLERELKILAQYASESFSTNLL